MFERILVPTDGSETAAAAMDQAIAFAQREGAELHVVHVIDTGAYDTSIESAVAPLRKRGDRYLERLVDAATSAGLQPTTAIELGRPARVILEYVNDHDVDLVVMGTSGRGGLTRRVLGSVTDYVVAHAEVPVHVVPAVTEPE